MGTGRVDTLPWLTGLETPVTVLQLTGAVVDSAGRAIAQPAGGVRPRSDFVSVSYC